MEHIKRADRICAITAMLLSSPNKVFTFSTFTDMFGAAKSTISEDIDIIAQSVATFGLGEVKTIAGAAGGVRYRAYPSEKRIDTFIRNLCFRLSEPNRVLPGGFLYTSDITSESDTVHMVGELIASLYYEYEPDIVLTMETKGIPIASAAAVSLGVPLIIARRDSKAYEGSSVKISYTTGNDNETDTMALPRRAVKQGQKVLIVDDFAKGGGTLKGMQEIIAEFDAKVVGTCVFIATANAPLTALNVSSLLTIKSIDPATKMAVVDYGNFR